MNYLNSFNIPKFLYAGKLPSTGDLDKDIEILHAQQLYLNEGLSTEGTPVYLLTEQSYDVPLKNATKFNINILDKFGNMLVDWKNPNMFYETGGKI